MPKNQSGRDKARALAALVRSPAKTKEEFLAAQRRAAREFGVGLMDSREMLGIYRELLRRKRISRSISFERLSRKRAVRTMSGIAPVAVLTKPYPCPGKCAYCPSEKNVPQSYLKNEPAVMRAIRCGYDPFRQTQDRLGALAANGHEPTKIELIVIGGTWSALPRAYKYWFILRLFAGANGFRVSGGQAPANGPGSGDYKGSSLKKLKGELKKEQAKNEKAEYRIIGLTLETRPDCINANELDEMLELGATRVELGVQAVDDRILRYNRRGHGVQAVVDATRRLKDRGFKVTYHIMPGLPGSTPARDLAMFKQLFADERFRPDQIKLYPCVVTKGSLLYRWWKQGKYRPYPAAALRRLIAACKAAVPEYVRIIRLIRDIPGGSIIAGNKITNLRQVLQSEGAACRCIRCREARERGHGSKDAKLKTIKYRASFGEEYFIAQESGKGDILYGFCRLRLNAVSGPGRTRLREAAMIRELHVYGELISVGSGLKKIQHSGLGAKLLKEAERIARSAGYGKMRIISGVGVRAYYRKFGYRRRGTYMEKSLI